MPRSHCGVPNASEYRAYPEGMDAPGDLRIRLAAFEWLREQVGVHGDVIPRTLLGQGFVFERLQSRYDRFLRAS
jgi:hypothetical protein